MDVANVESDGPANRRSQRVAAAGAKKKMESAEVEGAALDAIVEVKEDLGVRLWDIPDKTLVYIGVRRWVIESKVPVVRVKVSESDLRSSKLHGEDTRDISYDRVTKKRVVLPQPHPLLYSLATSLKLNTDSRHGMRFLFMIHRLVMPTGIKGELVADTRYRINQAFEDYLAFINQEWTLGGRVWPEELKALGPSIIYAVNAARVGDLRRFADRLRKWAGDQRNVNRHLEDSSVSVNITPQNFYALLGKRALRGRSTHESGNIITFQPHSLREFDVFFPPTMSDRHSERAGNVHPRFGHQLSERWYSTHYDDSGGAACAYKVKLESGARLNYSILSEQMWVVGRFIKWEKRILPVAQPAAQQQNARGSAVAAQHALYCGVEAEAQGAGNIGQEAAAREAETEEAQQDAAEMVGRQGEVAEVPGGLLRGEEGSAQLRQGAEQALPAPQALAGLAVAPELLMPWRTRDSIVSKKRAEQIVAEAGDAF